MVWRQCNFYGDQDAKYERLALGVSLKSAVKFMLGYKLGPIYVKLIGYKLGSVGRIKLEIFERIYLVTLVGSYDGSKDVKIDGSLVGI